MKKNNLKIIYDKNSRVLSVEIGKGKSADSDIQGNAVLDYDRKGKIVRINLYDFSFDVFKENQRVLRSFARDIKASLAIG